MIPQTLTNFNLFIDGLSYAGIATEVSLPKLKRKTDDHRAGGMDGPIKVGLGMEGMESSFTLAGTGKEAMAFFGLADDTAFNGVFRGAYKNQKGAVEKAEATFRGMLEEVDPGSWKSGDKAETKFNCALSYYKLELDGQVIHEIDPVNCIRIINGVDELAKEREALGI